MTKHITVHSDDPAQPRFRLTMKGEIRPLASFSPARVNLGRTIRGTTSTQYAYFSSTVEGLKMTRVTSSRPEIATAKITQHQGKDALEITVKAEGQGHKRADLTVKTNKPKEVPELRLSVTVLVSDPLFASPVKMLFTKPPEGKPAASRVVRVKAVGDTPFTLTGAEDPEGVVEATVDKPGDIWFVRATPTRFDTRSGTLRITTDLEDQPVIEVQYTIRDTPRHRRAPIRRPKKK